MKKTINYVLCMLWCLGVGAYGQSMGQGKLLFEAGKYLDAEKIFIAIPRTDHLYAEARYYLGRIAFDRKTFEEAASFFEEATEREAKNAEYFHYLGLASAEVAKTATIFSKPSWASQARKAWETAATLDNKSLPPRLSLIDYYSMVPGVMGGSMDKAKAMAHEVMKLNEAEGHWRLGNLLASENNRAAAEKEFGKMMKVNPDYVRNLAGYYADQKDYEKAMDLFEQALQRNPDDFITMYRYGKSSAISGLKLERGEVCLKRYVNYLPQYGEPSVAGAYMRLGQIYERRGSRPDARRSYEAALRLDRNLKEAREGLERVK
jgi:tetratricopeptide (TPR) repeat protein